MLGMGGFGLPSTLVLSGAVTATSYTVTGSTIPVNGLYLPATNTVGLATNSTLRLSVSTTQFLSTLAGRFGLNTITANTSGDDLVVQVAAATNGGFSVLGDDAQDQNIFLGSTTVPAGAGLNWNHDVSQLAIRTIKVGASLVLRAGNDITNLTLSGAAGSELATFAGDVTLSEGKLTITDTANETTVTVTSSATTANALTMECSALTSGFIANFYSNSSNASARYLVRVHNDHGSATGAVNLLLQQDAANAFIDFVGTAGANATDPISTFATAGAGYGWAQVDVNGSKKWIKLYEDPSA